MGLIWHMGCLRSMGILIGSGNMKISSFVYGDERRIFVNTDMGCKANCQYCYLPALDIVHGKRRIDANQAIELVESQAYYKSGEKGSIISIGCYSECMDKNNIRDTISLVKYFAGKGNYVQLATKKKIEKCFFEETIKDTNIEKHLWVYVSLPIITNYHLMERGTDSPSERIENFDLCKQYNINSVLYIKPYIDGITNLDIVHYSKIVNQYNISAVVGSRLSTRCMGKETLVGEERLFEYNVENMDIFIHQLRKETKVYTHSIDCIKQ